MGESGTDTLPQATPSFDAQQEWCPPGASRQSAAASQVEEGMVPAGSRASAGMSAAESNAEDQLLIIQPDAPLVDGLRALLVHHLKRSVGTSVINLSASQAELLEHHLSRLASYAQKIVHTLAFATRFLSKHQFEGEHGEAMDSPHSDNFAGRAPADGSYPGTMLGGPAQAPAAEVARPPRKSLKLNDDEILMLYRSAQVEAAIEADWRGIQGPAPNVAPSNGDAAATATSSERDTGPADGVAGTNGGFSSRAAGVAGPIGSNANNGGTYTEAEQNNKREDQEYLRLISRALQESGRSPQVIAAEVMEPRKSATCCRPGVPGMLDGVMGHGVAAEFGDAGGGGRSDGGLDMANSSGATVAG